MANLELALRTFHRLHQKNSIFIVYSTASGFWAPTHCSSQFEPSRVFFLSVLKFPTSVMEVARLQRQWTQYVVSLLAEKILDAQFIEIRKLQDESTPEFVFDIFSLFFETSAEIIGDLSKILEKKIVDFEWVDSQLHQLKGSCQSIGAMRIRDTCLAFRNFCAVKNVERCKQWLQLLKHERGALKEKMELLFALEAKIVGAGGTVPTLD